MASAPAAAAAAARRRALPTRAARALQREVRAGVAARYLVYRGRLGLLPAGLRVLQAEAYIDGPHGRELSGRWHAQALPAAEAAATAPPFAPRRGTRLAAGPT